MPPGSNAADEATEVAAHDERLVLILTLFRLYRAREPDDARLGQLVAAVRCAELSDGEYPGRGDDEEGLRRRILLSARAVQGFLATNA